MKHLFDLAALGTSVRRECVAGVTTFLTMAYVIFVNPNILSVTGMDKGALITATIGASAFGTLLAGLWANVPFAMAPGMGLNAFFAYSLVLGNQISWQTALGVVFVSGVFFLVLTLCGVRARVVRAIPLHLRLAIASGIGLFIAFIGMQNMGLIQDSEATLVTLGTFSTPLLLGLLGLVATLALEVRRVPGAILLGIVFTTVLGIVTGTVALPSQMVSPPPSLKPLLFQLDVAGALRWGLWGAIFSFMFVDLFDSVGTVVACSYEAGLVEPDGSIRKIDRILQADAVATVAGALLGTSTTTTYIESGTGIAAGGRSGLANVVTGVLFLAALGFTPLVGVVPAFATAPALIVVGIYMFKNIRQIDFTDFAVAVPAFLTIAVMPLTYSISLGLGFGFVSYVLIQVVSGNARRIDPIMWVIGALAALDLVLAAT